MTFELGYPKTFIRRSWSLSLPVEQRGRWFILWTACSTIPPGMGPDPVPYDSQADAFTALDRYRAARMAEQPPVEESDG